MNPYGGSNSNGGYGKFLFFIEIKKKYINCLFFLKVVVTKVSEAVVVVAAVQILTVAIPVTWLAVVVAADEDVSERKR